MPVIEHGIHPSTQTGPDWRYGCWNMPRPVKSQSVQSKFSGSNWKYIFSTECRFDMSLSDPSCSECEWRGSGERYDQMIRENGK